MVDYNTAGYDEVRAFVEGDFNWVAILDDTGTELVRWDLTANANVTQVSGSASNPLEYDVVITGQDLENNGFTLPVTVEDVQLYQTSGGADSVTPQVNIEDSQGVDSLATLEASADELTITVIQRWPP